MNYSRIAYEIGVPTRQGEKIGESELIVGSIYMNQSPGMNQTSGLKDESEDSRFHREKSIFKENPDGCMLKQDNSIHAQMLESWTEFEDKKPE